MNDNGKVPVIAVSRRVRGYVAVLMVVLWTTAVMGQQGIGVDDQALTGAAGNADGWLTTGRDYSETRYSPLKQIDSANVGRLGLAWYYETGSEPGALEATPILADGVLYTTLTWNVVIAVDARTGKLKWRYDPHIARENFPPGSQYDPNRVRTGPTMLTPVNRGVAVYDDKVYVGLLNGKLIALHAKTGKLLWEAQTTDPNGDWGITGAPRVVKGNVIIGNAGADFGVRGYVSAYNAETGKLAWRFYVVPGDPSKPPVDEAEARARKTWKGDAWYKIGGGGTPWDSFAYDPDLDLLYVGTGNGGPWAQDWRSPGGGDNLYLSSIVALRPETGKLVWYFQETPGDEWDYTATQDMILADLKIDGRLRKVILQAPKNGFFYVLDRKSGKFISALPYAYMNWATGIDQKTGRPIVSPIAHYNTTGALLWPGTGGAHSWPTMSFNPDTGLAYIPAQNGSYFYKEDPSHFIYRLGYVDRGLSLDPTKKDWDQPVAQAPPVTGPKPPNGPFLLAWDPVVQKERWRVPGVGTSTMTTAGNLVFTGASDGHFMALSADKGDKLWQTQLAPGFGSPITYMLDGKQYVSVVTGRAGAGRLYTFVLDGNRTMPSAPTKMITGKTTQDGVYSSEQASRGQTRYAQNCAACHGNDLMGNGDAPALVGQTFAQTWSGHTVADLFGVLSSTMPKGEPGTLSPTDYADIVAYIFKVNYFPPGEDQLGSAPAALRDITVIPSNSPQ